MVSRFFRRDRSEDDRVPPPRMPVSITPIGWVRNSITDPDRHDWSRVVSRVVLRDDLVHALDGLDGFSHVIVVCWLDRVGEDERGLKSVHPAGDMSIEARGVLALRTHHRPNPIGISVVALERVSGAVLRVRGLDAADRTPVLDIKPYLPTYDSVPHARLPRWAIG
jgi:tRNA (adenine37-N6)-methyltransferase